MRRSAIVFGSVCTVAHRSRPSCMSSATVVSSVAHSSGVVASLPEKCDTRYLLQHVTVATGSEPCIHVVTSICSGASAEPGSAEMCTRDGCRNMDDTFMYESPPCIVRLAASRISTTICPTTVSVADADDDDDGDDE